MIAAHPPVTSFTTFPRGSGHCATWLSVNSDVNVSHVCRGAGQVHIPVNTFGFCCAAVLLSLPQAWLQQRLYLLLTCPQAVLQAHRQHWVNTITLLNINREQSMTFSTFKYGFGRMFVCIPGHCEWPVTRSWWGSGRTRRHLGSLDRDLEQLPLRCPLPPWMEDWRWSWHLRKQHKHVLQHRTSTAQFGSHYKTLYPLSFQWMNRTVHACSLESLFLLGRDALQLTNINWLQTSQYPCLSPGNMTHILREHYTSAPLNLQHLLMNNENMAAMITDWVQEGRNQ